VSRLKAADAEAIMQVRGVGPQLARTIVAALHSS